MNESIHPIPGTARPIHGRPLACVGCSVLIIVVIAVAILLFNSLTLPFSDSLAQHLAHSLAAADLDQPEVAVEAGREALDSFWDYPWYDSSQDDVRRIRIRPPKPQRRTSTGGTWSAGNWDFSWFKWLAYAAIVALIGGIAYLLFRAYADRERLLQRRARDQARAEDSRSDQERVESLPFQVTRVKSDLLSEARRLYEAGNYGEAIVYLYSHELVELDKHQVIRLTRGKTNRQYLWEAGVGKPLGRLLERTMILFEESFFGNHPISRRQFEACWNELPEFNRLLERTQA